VEWERFLGKKVKVVQKDGFIKHGILKEVSEGFIILEFNDGSLNMIKKEFIISIVIMNRREKS